MHLQVKKIIALFIITLFSFTAAYAAISEGAFKQILKTGTPDDVQRAITGGVNMDMTQALCYASRYAKKPGIVDVLVKNGADINTKQCYSLGLARKTAPLAISCYTKNPVTTEDLMRLGADPNNFLFPYAYDINLAKAYLKYANSTQVEQYLAFARSQMNDNQLLSTERDGFRQIAIYIQSIDVNMPDLVGKNKADIVIQFGAPTQKMDIDKDTEAWVYYKHLDDTHYNGQVQGSSTYWGLGMSTNNANVTGGYTATNSERLTLVFQNGLVVKAKKNYDRQLH